ncbi:tetratricopeptide repeat protein [Lentzea alba]|uniref:AfsR/SARP family transcriptional regulator n=1 Tax=Lentzea alba TaxID=2714351 RepID=UPI0039BF61F4
MRFGILGPVAAWDGDVPAHIGGPRERKLLASLLLASGRTVALERLVVVLWDDEPPRTCRSQIHNSAAALRRNLGVAVIWKAAGLALDSPEVDLRRFEDLRREADELVAAQRLADAVTALREALALWRGPALAGADSRVLAAEADRLEAQRLACLERRVELDLALGRHHDLIGELTTLVAEHPLRESLRAKLMLALHRSGRRADALGVYQRARRVFADELGLDPGSELTELESMILRDAPALRLGTPHRVPWQLPRDAGGFTGRDDELERLDRADSECLLITGPAGVGKTSLAVHWARRAEDRFPDGQLYVDLCGHGHRPALEPIDVLGRFARALGVPPEQIPIALDEAAATFRTLLANKRMLVVLDNAAAAAQVRPLLPGEPGCLVVVTSRYLLSGLLATQGTFRLALDVLSAAQAETLLRTHLGDRVTAEPAAVADLVSLCGGLPLALRIAAAGLADRPREPISTYVAWLRDGDRLSGLSTPGDDQASVRRAFDHSLARLPVAAQRLFALLGLVPGPNFSPAAATALAGTDTRQSLDQLVAAHLVERIGHDVYRMHDLLRLYAAELTPPGERDCALTRLFEHYLDGVDSAACVLYPEKLRLQDTLPPQAFVSHADATAWLDAQRDNLVAAVRHAAEHGHPAVTVRLADGLRGYFELRRPHTDWLAVVTAGLAAAKATSDPRASAALMLSTAAAHASTGDYDLAEQEYGQALRLARAADWPQAQSDALNRLGATMWVTDRLPAAIEHMQAALEIDERTGRGSGRAASLNNLGILHWHVGRLAEALDYCTQSQTWYRRSGSPIGDGLSSTNVGGILLHLGRYDESGSTLTEAIALNHRLGNHAFAALGNAALALVHLRQGDTSAALHGARAALAHNEELGQNRIRVDVLNVAGAALLGAGEPDEAHEQHLTAQRLLATTTYLPGSAMTLVGLANTSLVDGTPSAARDLAAQALQISRDSGFALHEGEALTTLATVALAESRLAEATDLAEQAITVHSTTGYRDGRDRAEAVLHDARSR